MSILNWFFGSSVLAPPMEPWDERRALVKWNGREPWTIGESFEGVQVFGDTGSGKSSTSAAGAAAAMLRAGYGGLVLTVKPEETAQWHAHLDENGRQEDAVFFSPEEAIVSTSWLRTDARRAVGIRQQERHPHFGGTGEHGAT